MSTWIITGASGSLATSCINELLNIGKTVVGFSRSSVNDSRINFSQVLDYTDLDFNTDNCEGLIVAQGAFRYSLFQSTAYSEIQNLIEANFLSQIQVIHSFLNRVDRSQRVNVVILGSTSAYESGKGTVIYGAAKAGMLAFVKALKWRKLSYKT